MNLLRVKAYTLTSRKVGEQDRVLTLLTRDHGVISAFANGSCRPRSPLLALSLPYILASYELRFSRGRYTVRGGELLHSFPELREDFDRLAEAARLARIFGDVQRFDLPLAAVYTLFGHALYALCQKPDPGLVAAVAALRLLAEIGFAPWLEDCVVCHEASEDRAAFSEAEGGVLCRRHAASRSVRRLSPPLFQLLEYVLESTLENLFSFAVQGAVVSDFKALVWPYLERHLDRQYPLFILNTPTPQSEAKAGENEIQQPL